MEEMQSNCDLELRLLPPPPCDPSTSENLQLKQESQKMVIFYNGHVYVSSDLTQLQAKAILSLASEDMKEGSLSFESSVGSDPSTIPNILTRKASMKRSLRSFLQKRNVRIQASCPHQHSR